MVNLICFPHYTCGGLLCDILNQTFSSVAPNGGINSLQHSLGKIGDSDTVFDNYNADEFLKDIQELEDKNAGWVGTHCWPGLLPLDKIGKIIVVTTTSYQSKLFRWDRAYRHFYTKQADWQGLEEMELLDKARETAKNYLVPFRPVFHKNVTNIEFADIVWQTQEFRQIVQGFESKKHTARWQDINSFLYREDILNSYTAQRLYEAEVETQLKRSYIYH